MKKKKCSKLLSAEIRTYDLYNVVLISLSGDVPLNKAPSVVGRVSRAALFNRSMNAVVDLREARIQAETVDIQQMGTRCAARNIADNHTFRIAVVCGDDYTFGICRMVAVEMAQTPFRMKVVNTMDDALTWAMETEYLFQEFETG